MKESFVIDYPQTDAGRKAWNKMYGMNALYAGKHWSKRREDAQFWHQLTTLSIKKAHCRKKPFEKPVVISFLWNDRLDLSNHCYMAKMIEDAMKGVLIVDDSRKFVRGIEFYFHSGNYIRVIVTEIEDE